MLQLRKKQREKEWEENVQTVRNACLSYFFSCKQKNYKKKREIAQKEELGEREEKWQKDGNLTLQPVTVDVLNGYEEEWNTF